VNPEYASRLLRDIHGIDPVSWWPPAPGWWLVLLALMLLPALLSAARHSFKQYRRRPLGSWRRDAAARLHRLRSRVDQASSKDIAAELSELLRRIAVARCGREFCAGLAGPQWLDWLAENDPVGFDWRSRGRFLIELPYAPPDIGNRRAELHELVNAALAWTAGTESCPRAQPAEETANV
jgi:hypothetical protein